VGRRAAARRHSDQEVGGGGLVHPKEEATRLGEWAVLRSWTGSTMAELCGRIGLNRRPTLAASMNQMVPKILMTWINQDPDNGGRLISFI
jgi:hypothetical protein